MKSLLLDRSTWDLSLDVNGNLAICSEPYAVLQDVACAIRVFAGECYYDTSLGLPYFSMILGRGQSSVGTVVFCSDATSGLQAHTFPTEGCYLWWNGTAWVDYLGFPYTSGNFPGGSAQISVQKMSVTYELDVGANQFLYGALSVLDSGLIDMQGQTVIKSSAANTLAKVKANTNTSQNVASALAWASDACAPGQASGAGTGRWIYRDTAGNWLDFATGAAATA